tara:strand:- start:529 stop:771 length:243 start_codon:yes stop_codon:yes gene_type:complete
MEATEVLVIILSIFLAIFLIVGIALVALLIKVTLQIKKVTSAADKAVTNAEAFTANISKATSQAYLGRMLMKQLKKLTKK